MVKKLWRLVVDGEKCPAENMATDENMMEECRKTGVPILRFYKWQVPTLSLGYFQNIDEVDLAKCSAHNVAVIRRPTGGRAVLHKEELTYSIAMPKSCLPGTLLTTYRELSEALALGLRRLGLSAIITSGKNKIMANTAACFDAPALYELTVQGRKIIGSAQTRRGDIILQHGSIPIYNHNDLLLRLLNLSTGKRAALARVLERSAGSIMDFESDLRIDASRTYFELLGPIEDALLEGFKEAFAVKFAQRSLTANEKQAVKRLMVLKYSHDSWNLERRIPDG